MSSSDRFSVALNTLHWGPSTLGAMAHVDERTVRRWLKGDYDPPERILAWLEDLAAYHAAHPAP